MPAPPGTRCSQGHSALPVESRDISPISWRKSTPCHISKAKTSRSRRRPGSASEAGGPLAASRRSADRKGVTKDTFASGDIARSRATPPPPCFCFRHRSQGRQSALLLRRHGARHGVQRQPGCTGQGIRQCRMRMVAPGRPQRRGRGPSCQRAAVQIPAEVAVPAQPGGGIRTKASRNGSRPA